MVPKNTKKIMLYLLRNLELVNINQISKRINISVGSAFKILRELKKNNLVLSSDLGNAKFYQINLNNEETIRWCEILLSEEKRNLKGYSKIYSEEIQKENLIKEIKDKKEVILNILKTGIILKGEFALLKILKNVRQQK